MGFLDKLLGRAKTEAGELAEKAGPMLEKAVDEAKETAAGLAEKHGDKVTGAVDKAADFVDEKTGGKLSGVTDKVQDVTHDAVDAAKGMGESTPADAPAEATTPSDAA